MKKNMIILSIFAVLFLSLLFSIHAKGEEARENQLYEAACRMQEQTYLSEVKEYLNDKGYTNIGVTMNRVVDGDGTRFYTLSLYHKRLHRLSEEDRLLLENELTEMGSILPDCTLRFDIQQ